MRGSASRGGRGGGGGRGPAERGEAGCGVRGAGDGGPGAGFRAILRPCGPAKVSDLLSQLVSVSGGQEAPRVGAGMDVSETIMCLLRGSLWHRRRPDSPVGRCR